MISQELSKKLAVIFGIFSSAYLSVSVISILIITGIIPDLPGFGTGLNSVMMIIVGIVFLFGSRHLIRGEREGVAYVVVGFVLAFILFLLQIIIILTNTLGHFLLFEEWSSWNIAQDIIPNIWLFLFLLIGGAVLRHTGILHQMLEGIERRKIR